MKETPQPQALTAEIEDLRAQVDDLARLEEESERRYHVLEKVSPVGIFHTDADGNCLYVNKRWCTMTGLTPAQAHGKGWKMSLHPEDRDRVVAAWRQAVAEGTEFREEYRFVRPDGSEVWVLGQAVTERDDDGRVVGLIRTATDITKRKLAELALAESEQKFRALAESVNAGIVIYQAGVIRHVNRGITTLTGFEGEELIGRKFGELIHPEHREAVKETGKTLERGEDCHARFEVKMVTSDDQERWVDYSLGVLEYDGRPALIGSAFDITDRKRAERLAALGMTASGLAHYIKNVQTHLMGSMTILDEAITEGNQAAVQKIWPIMRRASRRINTLVRDMLSIARERKIDPNPVDVAALIDDLQTDLRPQADENGVTLEVAVEEGLPPAAGEESRLHDALLNLTGNAIEAILEAEIEDGLVRVEAARDGAMIVLRVIDNGPGIPPEVAEKIFEPFFTTKGSKGTGLGLAVVKRTAEELGGNLDLKTAPGQGAAFTLRLPVYQ